MLSPSDLLPLPYTPDLTEGGIAYACRSLTCTFHRPGGAVFDRLRRVAGGVVVDVAFRRHLAEQGIPFDVLSATPFTEPDRYEISLGGHRCYVQSFLLTRREQIRAVHREPGFLLQSQALIPLEQFAGEGHNSQDIHLFAFLLALTTPSQIDTKKAIAACQPFHLIHSMPEAWAQPRTWQPLEKLALKSECEEPLTVEIGGMDAMRNFLTTPLELPPRKRLAVEQGFYSLGYIHARSQPEARLGIHSPVRGEVHLVHPHEWGNIWVYGMGILLAGYLTHEEFRRKAHVLPIGSRTFQYERTKVKNLAVPLAELRPLGPLFERVRTWEVGKKT